MDRTFASVRLSPSAAASSSQPAPSPPYTSPDWLDARIQVYQPSFPPSYDARIVFDVYLVHAIVVPLFITFGVIVAGHRFRKRRLMPFQRVAGRVVPVAVESWVVFSLSFLFFRWLHSILLLLDVLPTFALRELSNDIGYSVFHIAVLLYVYAILHSTPILTTLPEGRHPLLSQLGAIQARHQTGFRLFFMSNLLLVFVPPVLAVLSGLAADSGDVATAVQYVKIHYLLWTAEVVVAMVYFLVCGFLLSLHIRERVKTARDEGLEGPGLDAITVSMQSVNATIMSMFSMPLSVFISYIGIFRGSRKLEAIGQSISITTHARAPPADDGECGGGPGTRDSSTPLCELATAAPPPSSPPLSPPLPAAAAWRGAMIRSN
ncbi:hypothetical protein DFJ73DRAFT_802893 [Zopfochytrium polystomum]|nr:hypothetical protein DFJ73DRAFT_802893 [Zopfochytrium polystomum]